MELVMVEQCLQTSESKHTDENKGTNNDASCNSENVCDSGARRNKRFAVVRPTLWYLFNFSLHYLDFLFDILLCFGYFHLEESKQR